MRLEAGISDFILQTENFIAFSSPALSKIEILNTLASADC